MPKLPDIKILAENPTALDRANRFETATFATFVGADGVFSATLPEYLVELARLLTLPVGVSMGFGRSYWRMQSKQLDSLRHALQSLMNAWMTPVIKVERVILYNVASHISFFEAPESITKRLSCEGMLPRLNMH